MCEVTLDYVDEIKYSVDCKPLKNMQALDYLSHGIFRLAQTVRAEEIQWSEQGFVFSMGGIDPIVVAAFDWFVISVTNYARIVGLVDLMVTEKWTSLELCEQQNQRRVKQHCDQYMKRVLPNVSEWRNKVSAHPAATDPRSNDNQASIEHSLMCLVTYNKPYFEVSAKWSTGGYSSQLPSWTLTKVLEENLIPRFWPKMKLDPIK